MSASKCGVGRFAHWASFIELALLDSDSRNRKKAVFALTYLREMVHVASKRALLHQDAVIRYHALLELSSRINPDVERVRFCMTCLTDPDEHVRWLSASQLRWLRCLEEGSRSELIEAVKRALAGECAPRVAAELSEVLATHLSR